MDPSTLEQLLNISALQALDSVDYSRADELKLQADLRSRGFSPELTAAILTQAQLRVHAQAKFGDFASGMLFTRDGLAQATRLPVAAHHAARMQRAGVTSVADLGCGIGADSLAMAGVGLDVSAVEIDEVTAAIAAYNLRIFDGVNVTHGAAEDFDLTRVDGLWCDPARRLGTHADGQARRLNDPEAFSPSLTWVKEAATRVRAAGIKLGPALDHALVPPGWEAQWVSHDGDVVEVCLYAGEACERPGRSALVMYSAGNGTEAGESGAAGTLAVHESELPSEDEPGLGTVGEYLFEPDGALVRAGLVTALCEPLAAWRISPTIAYLTGDAPVTGVAARAVSQYRIVDVLPAGIKALRAALVERGIGRVVIKKRGMDIDPDKVRRQLKLSAGKKAGRKAASEKAGSEAASETATLVFTRVGEDHVVLLTQPLP